MIRFQTYALATSLTFLGGLAASAAIGHKAASAAPQAPALPVQELAVTGPNPSFAVPVTGTVTADQGGAWNVGILGTPTVNVANSPPVTISNSAALPFFVRNVDDPGRIAYQSINQVNSCSGFCSWQSPTVPAGHRLVVEHVSGNVQFTGVPQLVSINVQHISGSPITGTRLPQPYDTSMDFDLPVHFYVDAGQFYVIAAFASGASFDTSVAPATFNATGYMLDCSSAPCAPIAQ